MQVLNNLPGVPSPVGVYSQATRIGEILFCSGQIAINPESGNLVDGGVAEQTEQVLRNISAVLRGAGSSVDRIAMTTIFLTDIKDGAVVNKIYRDFVPQDKEPARQTVAVKA